MKTIITGGTGFLGQRLAAQLLKTHGAALKLVLVDRVKTTAFEGDVRVQSVDCDVADTAVMERLIPAERRSSIISLPSAWPAGRPIRYRACVQPGIRADNAFAAILRQCQREASSRT
jgi:nucleoside-diphosphate-sugar epimerase